MFFQKCVILTSLFFVTHGQLRIDPLVETDVGLIRGLRADDGDYTMFLGIPFAQVDENNPFGASTPYSPFERTFEAYEDSAPCPQIDEYVPGLFGSLDCLKLNIFVPQSATSLNRLPVLVWIYGGGFTVGFGNRYLYGPKFLIRHDIILVTINYRLGPYGFMCLDNPQIPGNQGLKDQLLALRWIHRNIGAFGGDANRITIFGESAGSISVDLHLQSNNEKLYDKAILHSATVLSPMSRARDGRAPVTLAEHLGFPTDNINEAVEFLARADPRLLVSAVNDLGLNPTFRPCIENEFEGVESIVTQNWITAPLPKVRNMPILLGFNDNERLRFHLYDTDEYYENSNTLESNLARAFDVNNVDFIGMEDIVRHFYFGDEPMSAAIRQSIMDFESDLHYMHPTYRSISKYLDYDAGNIYLYLFSYLGERNLERYRLNITSGTGAVHADELGYLFDVSFMRDQAVTPEDQLVIDRMTTMWANFVKFGNPTPQTSDLLPVQWTAITSHSNLPYLNIDSELTLGARPLNKRATFWDLFYTANKHLQIPYPNYRTEL